MTGGRAPKSAAGGPAATAASREGESGGEGFVCLRKEVEKIAGNGYPPIFSLEKIA